MLLPEIDGKINEQSELLIGSSKENSKRMNFLSKKLAKLLVDMNCSLKIHVD